MKATRILCLATLLAASIGLTPNAMASTSSTYCVRSANDVYTCKTPKIYVANSNQVYISVNPNGACRGKVDWFLYYNNGAALRSQTNVTSFWGPISAKSGQYAFLVVRTHEGVCPLANFRRTIIWTSSK